MRKELLRIQNLQLSDPASEAFRYFSFSILEGEAVCILAPSLFSQVFFPLKSRDF